MDGDRVGGVAAHRVGYSSAGAYNPCGHSISRMGDALPMSSDGSVTGWIDMLQAGDRAVRNGSGSGTSRAWWGWPAPGLQGAPLCRRRGGRGVERL